MVQTGQFCLGWQAGRACKDGWAGEKMNFVCMQEVGTTYWEAGSEAGLNHSIVLLPMSGALPAA